MPRHPPCALKNLKPQRCSRPLYSSQHTTRPTPDKLAHQHTPTPTPTETARSTSRRGSGRTRGPGQPERPASPPPPEGRDEGPIPQDPTTCQHHTHHAPTSFPHPPRKRSRTHQDRHATARGDRSSTFHPEQPTVGHSPTQQAHMTPDHPRRPGQ